MNVPKFKGVLAEKGITQEQVSHIIGIDPSTFYRKMASGGDKFTIGDMQKIISGLSLTEKEAVLIFLRRNQYNQRGNGKNEICKR